MTTETTTSRRPRGYQGHDHETIGSDILAVLDAVTLPDDVLGPELASRLRGVEPTQWYPIALLLEALERLDERLGYYGLIRMGRRLWKRSHEPRLRASLTSAADVILGMDAAYRYANRGSRIGGWRTLQLVPGRAVLDKTTPHHCAMEEGILTEALAMVGARSVVSQTQCFRQGADSCIYEVVSSVRDDRWMGDHARIEQPSAPAGPHAGS